MYSQFRKLHVSQCLSLPDGTQPAEGASCFVNPLTALGMVETLRREGHTALVHTAAASNLGQMLNKVCQQDGIELVNIVRKPEQEEILRQLGAKHVVNSASAHFLDDLTAALTTTGATLAFDATGGGELASQILTAMERALMAGGALAPSDGLAAEYRDIDKTLGIARSAHIIMAQRRARALLAS